MQIKENTSFHPGKISLRVGRYKVCQQRICRCGMSQLHCCLWTFLYQEWRVLCKTAWLTSTLLTHTHPIHYICITCRLWFLPVCCDGVCACFPSHAMPCRLLWIIEFSLSLCRPTSWLCVLYQTKWVVRTLLWCLILCCTTSSSKACSFSPRMNKSSGWNVE